MRHVTTMPITIIQESEHPLTQHQVVDEIRAHLDASMSNRNTWDDGTPFRVLDVEVVSE